MTQALWEPVQASQALWGHVQALWGPAQASQALWGHVQALWGPAQASNHNLVLLRLCSKLQEQPVRSSA